MTVQWSLGSLNALVEANLEFSLGSLNVLADVTGIETSLVSLNAVTFTPIIQWSLGSLNVLAYQEPTITARIRAAQIIG